MVHEALTLCALCILQQRCYSNTIMKCSNPRTFLFIFVAAAICAPCKAQTNGNSNVHIQPAQTNEISPPFSVEVSTSERAKRIEFRSESQMTPEDRRLVADAASMIQKMADVEGIEFNRDKWNSQQMICPALPDHIFLLFTHNGGVGDVSEFSAAISRSRVGHVRIVPIQRRGYSLFSGAPINAMTISTFNQIRADERSNESRDWLTTGLCYAALSGAHLDISPATEKQEDDQTFGLTTPIIQVLGRGGVIIHFVVAASTPHPMEWTLEFDVKGKLLKATDTPASFRVVQTDIPATQILPDKK